MEGAFEATVAVVADEEVGALRAGERGHEVVDERSARQLTQDEKAELADLRGHKLRNCSRSSSRRCRSCLRS